MMDRELLKVIRSLYVPFTLVLIMIASLIVQENTALKMHLLGIYPLRWQSLHGILTTIFVHKDVSHLLSNAIPMLLLGSAVYYYYKEVANWALFLMTITTGLWVWVMARESYHIGASGLVYALASFHIVSAVLRREMKVMAFGMLVIFLYGSMIWGIFPEFFPEQRISWESHLMGGISGVVFAIYYRKAGPQKPLVRDYDDEEEDELGNVYAWPPEFYDDDEEQGPIIHYHVVKKKIDEEGRIDIG
jgi:membrane associated rhomboid family serine protease